MADLIGRGDSPVSIAYKHVQEAPRPPRSINLDVPPELEAITLQLLAKRPEDRYGSADDLRADLRRYREGFRVHAADRAAAAEADATAIAASAAVVPAPATAVARSYPPADPGYAPPQRRSWGFLVALAFLLAVLIGLLVLLAQTLGIGEDDGTPDAVQIAVPDVVDLAAADARAQLEAQGFVVEEDPEDVADAALVGIVVDQDPEGGIRIDEGSTVEIRVGAQDTRPMPNLVGSTPDQARNTLQGLGFTVEPNQQEEESDEVEPGLVSRTDPPSGEPVALNSTITLYVSGGPSNIAVPACDNLTESDCVTRVDGAGLNPASTLESSPTVIEGRVIRTEPANGTEVEPGSTVRIVVSSGPPATTTSSPPGTTSTTVDPGDGDVGD